MKISEIFVSLSGESKYSGYRTVFIRTFGCPLRCSYCDSHYAIEGTDFKEMSVQEIVEAADAFNCKRVVLTGGEPLIQPRIDDLINELTAKGYHVEIETCGAVDIRKYCTASFNEQIEFPDSITVTMDWKCPSSGMRDRMLESNLKYLRPTDVVKFVVGSEEDLEEMKNVRLATDAEAFVSPVFGKIELKDIAEYIIDNNINDVRFQLQIHKFVWPVDMRGV